MSDNGYVIISLFFDASHRTSGFQDENDFESMCEDRKRQGYNSGMGEIFRRVAAISPVNPRPSAFFAPHTLTVKQLRLEAFRRGLDLRGVNEKAEFIAMLELTQAAELRKLGAKALLAEASRRGLKTRGAEKEELVALLDAAIRSPRALQIDAPEAEYQGAKTSDTKSPSLMSVRELRSEVQRRGLDARGCLEKGDFVRLLTDKEEL